MSFTQDLNKVENIISEVGKQTLAIYAVDMTVGNNFVSPQDGLLIRNAKRGFLWELADEAVNEVTSSNSLIRQQDFMGVLDNVFYNSVVAGVTEQTNLFRIIEEVVGNNLPSGQWRDSVITASIITASKHFGKQLENTVIKNITSLFA